MTVNAVQIHPKDSVACLLCDLGPDARLVTAQGEGPEIKGRIRMGHKVALLAITAGTPVIKYGRPIGTATVDIAAGAHVHSHNVKGATR